MQQQYDEAAEEQVAPYEPRSRALQACVTPTDFDRVRTLVRRRRFKSISEWLYALVRRELESGADERPAA